jgi:hypothetical protein
MTENGNRLLASSIGNEGSPEGSFCPRSLDEMVVNFRLASGPVATCAGNPNANLPYSYSAK